METKYKQIIFILLLSIFAFTACNKFEMRGFFFSYESVDERFEQSIEWNKTHPYKKLTVPTDNYLLYIMGDSHCGGTDNTDIFFNEAMKGNAIAAVLVGDLATGHAEDFDSFANHIPHQDSITSFPIIGNHDLYFNGWEKFHSLWRTTTYLFTVETPEASDLYICTDTGSGTLGSEQLTWLTDILENERPNYRRCIIFTHNNLFRIRHTTSTNPNIEELYVLTELCSKHNIDMVITRHDHKKNAVVLGNTTHITMDALLDGGQNQGYFTLLVNGGEIEYEFVGL